MTCENSQKKADTGEVERRVTACVNAFEGIPTERIEGKDLGQILAGEMRLNGAGPRADGGFGFEFSGGVCQLLAEAYADQFKQSGAINYLELLFDHTEIGPLTITMQRVEGLTPAHKLAQAEAERDQLQEQVKALSGENVSLRDHCDEVYGAGYQQGHLNTVDGIAYAPGIKDDFYHDALQVMAEVETPATDAFVAEMKASGVDALTGRLRQFINEGDFVGDEIGLIQGAIDCGDEIAATLRAAPDVEEGV